MNSQSQPPPFRVIWAFIVAPAAAALAFAIVEPLAGLPSAVERVWNTFGVVTVFGGYVPTLLFGVPAFLLLRKRTRHPFRDCVATGAGVAALPWLLLAISGPPGAWLASGAWVDPHAGADGLPTLFGGLETAAFIGAIALFGSLGGAVFWLVAAAGHRHRPESLPPLP